MDVEEIQTQQQQQLCKFSRVGTNDRSETTRRPIVDEEDNGLNSSNLGNNGVDSNRLSRGWHHHSSRIIRVSRASGGKDRHSKVWTSKGLRDRRVRLSVTTAIQFYDLQDRLGYDQPSKAVEWLIKAATDSIAELPELDTPFPDAPNQLSNEKMCSDGGEQGFDSADIEPEDASFNPNVSLSKSAGSSNSETSKGSGHSLSRSGVQVNRVEARQIARERVAKEKDTGIYHPISQSSTFTELLTGVNNNASDNNHNAATAATTRSPDSEGDIFHKNATARQWPLMPMDYFNTGLIGTSREPHIQLGNSVPQAMTLAMAIPPFSVCGEQQQQQPQQLHMQQHFPFLSNHLIPVAAANATQKQPDYNLNFTISSSSGLAGFNRGTLQSNSSTTPSLLPHLRRFSSSTSMDGSTNLPFFIGLDNQQHHQPFQSGLQLYYGDGNGHADQKGKAKH